MNYCAMEPLGDSCSYQVHLATIKASFNRPQALQEANSIYKLNAYYAFGSRLELISITCSTEVVRHIRISQMGPFISFCRYFCPFDRQFIPFCSTSLFDPLLSLSHFQWKSI